MWRAASQRRLAPALERASPPAPQAPLQVPELLAALADLALQSLLLGVEQLLIEGRQHRALDPEDRLAGAPGADAGQTLVRQRDGPLGRPGQQVRMLGRQQRAGEMEGALRDEVEIFVGFVAFAEDERDLLRPVGEFVATWSDAATNWQGRRPRSDRGQQTRHPDVHSPIGVETGQCSATPLFLRS